MSGRNSGRCAVDGCERRAYRRGRCPKHYEAVKAVTGPQPFSGNLTPLLAEVGVSYRQIDFWCRTGRITLSQPAAGSGTRRMITADEAAAIRALASEIADIERRLAYVRSGRFFADHLEQVADEELVG